MSFGSELKALAAGPSFDRSIDRSALASYLRYLYVPAPKSIYRRAIKLPPASILKIADPRQPLPSARAYWSLRDAALDGLARPLDIPEADAVDQLDSLLKEAVTCRLQSDVPLGALLSGGIDSSTVVALMREATNGPVRTYTIALDDRDFDEARHAARVAEHLGTDHTELLLTGTEAQSLVPRLSEIFDEPHANPSQLPTLLVSQLARRHVTVALCGDGGDELFAGYNRYAYGTQVLPRVNRLPFAVRQPVGSCLSAVPAAAWDRMHNATASLVPSLSFQRVGERMHKLGTVMTAASTTDMYRSLLSAWQQPERLVAGCEPDDDLNGRILDARQPPHLLDRMMLADQTTYLPDDLLAKIDRTSMAVSLEVRAPLLDHRVAEFSWRLPLSLKLRGTVGKWALRQLLYRRVPREMVDRPKMGFSVPIDRWLRGPLRSWAEDLLPSAADDLLDGAAIRRAWDDLQAGRRHAGECVWAVVMFQAWKARWQWTARPRLLFLCQTLPDPPDGGVWLRTYHILRLLAAAFDITALCFERAAPNAADLKVRTNPIRTTDLEVFEIPQKHSRLRFVWDHLRSAALRRVYTHYVYDSRAFDRRLAHLLRTIRFDVVHIDSLVDLGRYLPAFDGIPVVGVHHDVGSDLLRRRAAIDANRWRGAYLRYQAALMTRAERTWCGRVALNVAVSDQDRIRLARIAPAARIAVVPNGVDLDEFCTEGAPPGQGIAYVGGTTPFPNADALDFFCREILPHVRALRPHLPIRWIGRASAEQQRSYLEQHGVELTGYVGDVRPLMRDAACHVVPLRVAGGTRLKILNAWAMGKAVVSTSIGCEGLAAVDGENIFIRDDPADFARAVDLVLENPSLRRRLEIEGRSTAQRLYGWNAIGRPMVETYLRLSHAQTRNASPVRAAVRGEARPQLG